MPSGHREPSERPRCHSEVAARSLSDSFSSAALDQAQFGSLRGANSYQEPLKFIIVGIVLDLNIHKRVKLTFHPKKQS